MKKSRLLSAVGACSSALATLLLLASTAAVSATVWAPTNEDTDFIQFDLGSPGISTNGGALALFDDSDTGFGTALVIGQVGGQVVFTDNNDGSWNAEVFDVTNTSGGSITLSGNTNFSLGIDWGAGYFGDTNFSLLSSPDTYLIVFDGFNGLGDRISGNTLAIDLAPIPVPAAVWLFGSGLLGLVGIARRKKAA
jgi:FlaG/FlaF family flagellin (archaellin)